MPSETPLTGGNLSDVVRPGDTVRRRGGPWTPCVHRLLAHLRARGVQEVPEPLGRDERGREVLSFLPGTVGHAPLAAALCTDEVLAQAARLLRRLHDATVDVAADPSWLVGWQAPVRAPAEVICHGDFAPYNAVYRGDRLVGVIDFDHAHPGPRSWDLAYAAYRFLPLMAPGNPEHRDSLPVQCRRLQAFLAAYGPFDTRGFVEVLAARLQRMVDHLVDGAASGNTLLAALIDRGDAELYAADRRHILANRAMIEAAISDLPRTKG